MNTGYTPEPPDYKHFARLPRWTIDEAVNLLAIAQLQGELFSGEEVFNEALKAEQSKIKTVMFALDERNLCAVHHMQAELEEGEDAITAAQRVYRDNFLHWANNQGYLPIPVAMPNGSPKELISGKDETNQNTDQEIEGNVTVDCSDAVTEVCKQRETPAKGIPGAIARWATREPLEKCAIDYMEQLLGMECACRHDVLANITYLTAKHNGLTLMEHDNKPMGPKMKSMGLRHFIKKTAKGMVPEERRYLTNTYVKTKCVCPIQDHRKYTNRAE